MGEQFRPQYPIVGVVRFLVGKRVEGHSCDIPDADKGDFAISAGCVDLALAFDGGKVSAFNEIFYSSIIKSRLIPPIAAETDP